MRFRSVSFVACVGTLFGCGGSGSSDDSTTSANAAPSVVGTPATIVWVGDPYVFLPRATDPDGDTLVFEIEGLPQWAAFDSATGTIRGVPTATDAGEYRAIRVGVGDGQHRVWLPPFDLTVRDVSHGAMLLSWDAPTANTDETPLDDLAGFKIYWGTDPKWPTDTVVVSGTAVTTHYFTGLSPGTYYFATTAVNAMGIESDRSDLATMVVR